jgi:sugar lactone lactonase YvrE
LGIKEGFCYNYSGGHMARVRFISNSLIQVGNILGECPLWHPTENALYWLDIDAGLLHRFTPYLEKIDRKSVV